MVLVVVFLLVCSFYFFILEPLFLSTATGVCVCVCVCFVIVLSVLNQCQRDYYYDYEYYRNRVPNLTPVRMSLPVIRLVEMEFLLALPVLYKRVMISHQTPQEFIGMKFNDWHASVYVICIHRRIDESQI